MADVDRWWEGMTPDERRAHAVETASPDAVRLEKLATERVRNRRIQERSCGECRLCCKVLRIGESASVNGVQFDKPGHTWCEHSTLGGCAIRQDDTKIPVACTTFMCAWLGGFLEDHERPDKLRAVPKIEEGQPIGHAMVWYPEDAAPLSKLAQRAAQRMLDGSDAATEWKLPQGIAAASGHLRTMVLPGARMKGASGQPTRKQIVDYQRAFAVKLAGGAGMRAFDHGLPVARPGAEAPQSRAQRRRVAHLTKKHRKPVSKKD